MKRKLGRFLVVGVFLFLFPLIVPAMRSEAAPYNLIKEVSGEETPKGQLVRSGTRKRYLLSNGTWLKNQWVQIDGKIYHFNRSGYADTGWIMEKGNKYFLRASGALHKGGFLMIKGRRYFFKYGYAMLMTGWRTIGKEKYYFRETKNNGAMIRCWWVDEKYLGSDGKMKKNTWVGKYYVGEDGVRVKDTWVDDKYLGADGKLLKNAWVGDYYVDSKGEKVKNAWQGEYYLGADGRKVINAWVGDQYVGPDGKVTEPPDDDINMEVKRIFLGDSRTVGLYQIMTGDTLVKAVETQPVETQLQKGRKDIYIGKVAMGYDWMLGYAVEELRSVLRQYPVSKVTLRMGINDLGNINNYIALYKDLIQEFPRATFFVESVTPVNEKMAAAGGYTVTNKQILQFNTKLKRAFPSNYISSYNYVLKNKGKTVDGIHYQPGTYRMIYEFLDSVM